MSQLTEIIIKHGLIPDSMLEEMKRWGMPVGNTPPRDELAPPVTIERLCSAIDEAIQSEGYVLLRETDLEAIPQYLASMAEGTLHIVTDDAADGADFKVAYGKTATGDYILPWRGEGITDLLTNGASYLKAEGHKVFFSSARDLFYGQQRAFVVCTPSTREHDGGPR